MAIEPQNIMGKNWGGPTLNECNFLCRPSAHIAL